MIYIKFGEAGTKYANVGVTITNSIPEGEDPTQFHSLTDDFMGKDIILDNGVPRALTDAEVMAKLEAYHLESLGRTVRAQRDALLNDADKLTQADRWESYSSSTKTAVAAYKQALRDITTVSGFPTLLPEAWPTKPTV